MSAEYESDESRPEALRMLRDYLAFQNDISELKVDRELEKRFRAAIVTVPGEQDDVGRNASAPRRTTRSQSAEPSEVAVAEQGRPAASNRPVKADTVSADRQEKRERRDDAAARRGAQKRKRSLPPAESLRSASTGRLPWQDLNLDEDEPQERPSSVEDSPAATQMPASAALKAETLHPVSEESAETKPADPKPESLTTVRNDLGDCQRCRLCSSRENIVFGVGSESARLMFIGEAPGYHEDKQAEPFVGNAGQLLDKMIAAMGLSREQVYIANVLKCRPPENRNPQPDEVAKCAPFLKRQVDAVDPEVIITLGKFAASFVMGREVRITRERGQWQEALGRKVMPTFHPSYLLRKPEAKRESWADLQKVMAALSLERPTD